MEHTLFDVSRTSILTNSAAEYVETRAGDAILYQVTGADGASSSITRSEQAPLAFASTVDSFVRRDQAPNEADYYQESAKMRGKFYETLKNLTVNLQKKNVFDKLGLQARDPSEYTLEYVLSLAETINDKRTEGEDASTCKKFIKSCFRSINKRSGTIAGLIDMVPKDIYGSVISGGFTLILTAIEENEKLRSTIQGALAEIPRKLSKVQRLSALPFKPPRLHQHADAVLVAIFVVLGQIIDWLLKGRLERSMSSVKGKGTGIRQALDSLGEKISIFQDEVETCSHLRLGRMEEGLDRVDEGLFCVQTQMAGFDKTMTAIQETLLKERGTPDPMKDFCNMLYQFIASNPNFHAIDGSVNRPQITSYTSSKATTMPAEERTTSEELVKKWLKGLVGFKPSSNVHIKECLAAFEVLRPEEKDKAQWIMGSAELHNWLSTKRSNIFEISVENVPEELINNMTCASATLAMILANQTTAPVLSFFCGLRTNESFEVGVSDHLGLLRSLNGQLLKFILDNRDGADLAFLRKKKLLRESHNEPKHAIALFMELINALPDHDIIYVILDSFSHLTGDQSDKLVEKLAAFSAQMPGRVLKILVTDPLPSCPIRRIADISLYVPEEIFGFNDGIDIAQLEELQRNTIKRLERRQRKALETKIADSSDSDEDNW